MLSRLESGARHAFPRGIAGAVATRKGRGRGAQTHLPSNPQQSLGLPGRYRPRPERPVRPGRTGRRGRKTLPRQRINGNGRCASRWQPKCASDPHVVCALQYGFKRERRGFGETGSGPASPWTGGSGLGRRWSIRRPPRRGFGEPASSIRWGTRTPPPATVAPARSATASKASAGLAAHGYVAQPVRPAAAAPSKRRESHRCDSAPTGASRLSASRTHA